MKNKFIYVGIAILILAVAAVFWENNLENLGGNMEQKPVAGVSTSTQGNSGAISSTDKCPYNQKELKTSSEYRNSKLGFTMTLPSGWYVPTDETSNPHFFTCKEETGWSFEIHPDNLVRAQKYYASSTQAEKSFSDVIPNAIVREYKDPGLSEGDGWPHWYFIMFNGQNRAYMFSALQTIDHYPFLYTLTLIK